MGYLMQCVLFADWEGRFYWNIFKYKKNDGMGLSWMFIAVTAIVWSGWRLLFHPEKRDAGEKDEKPTSDVKP
jgi:hypothetical protein